ncbi:MAG: GTPase HflX [Thermoguttaceae bacterium]
MYELQRAESVASEAAVLVGVLLPDRRTDDEPLAELEGLATAAGVRVVGRLTQRLNTPYAATYLGRGKVDDLVGLAEFNDADVIIFDNDLSPAQTRNLEKATGRKVIDRTELILDIFASRARTYQARLAVELAQHEYAMPRLKRMWTHLSRQKKGVGLRGPGEKQLEEDRRLVEKRIRDLRRDLAAIEQRKQREVAARSDAMTVSLVGYTNAGKSTLMNALTGAGVFVQDALFATLDTRTRRWQLPGWGPVLLSDTVGFIRDLPHHLIASFKATLEEARQADLLLHVADAGNAAVHEQIAAAGRVLKELGIQEKDTLLVLNKADSLPDRARLDALLARYPAAIPISAQRRSGLRRLATAVSDALSRMFHDVDIEMGVENGRLLAYLAAHGEILSKRYVDSRVIVHCRLPRQHLGRIDEAGVTIQPHAGPRHRFDAPHPETRPRVEDVA